MSLHSSMQKPMLSVQDQLEEIEEAVNVPVDAGVPLGDNYGDNLAVTQNIRSNALRLSQQRDPAHNSFNA